MIPKVQGKSRLRKMIGATLLCGTVFRLGMYTERHFHDAVPSEYTVKSGYFPRPYDLAVEKTNTNGGLEVYLYDKAKDERYKIDAGLHVGSTEHQLKGCYSIMTSQLMEPPAYIAPRTQPAIPSVPSSDAQSLPRRPAIDMDRNERQDLEESLRAGIESAGKVIIAVSDLF